MKKINTLFNANYNDGRVLVEGIVCEYYPYGNDIYDANNLCRVRIASFPLERADSTVSVPYPSSYYDAFRFYDDNSIIYNSPQEQPTPPETPNNTTDTVTSFIAGALNGFFETEIYDGVTLGGILVTVLGSACAIWILKLFAGG